MFQPFEKFNSPFLEGLLKLEKNFLVSQTYTRAYDHFSDERRIDILLTDYDDRTAAEKHLHAIRDDKYAAIIELKKPGHLQKIKAMLAEDSEYRLYWAVVRNKKDIMKRLELKYENHIRRYVDKLNLNIKGSDTLRTSMKITYGEIYLVLSVYNHSITVKFEEIENA
jgi:hypothetical protein